MIYIYIETKPPFSNKTRFDPISKTKTLAASCARAMFNKGSLPWSASEPGALIQLEGGVALDLVVFWLVGWLVGWGQGGMGKLWNLWVFIYIFYMLIIYGCDICDLKRCG